MLLILCESEFDTALLEYFASDTYDRTHETLADLADLSLSLSLSSSLARSVAADR